MNTKTLKFTIFSIMLLSFIGLGLFSAKKAHAAITMTSLANAGSDTNATSYATASITPSANKLILLSVTSYLSTSPAAPTVSGNGLTWVQVATVSYPIGTGANDQRVTVFRAMGSSPSTGAVTISFGAATQDAARWSIVEFGNVDTTGTNGSGAVVQSVTNRADAVTSLTVTLAAFGSTSNATYGTFSTFNNNAITAGTGFTGIHEGGTTNQGRLQTQWRSDNDTTVNATWASDSAAGIAIEIKAVSALPTITTPTQTSITTTTAVLGGNVTADGGASITGRGVCVGTSANPALGGNCFTTTGETGVFTVTANSGMSANTLYHYRAYATNSVGTSYTTDDTFYTLPNTPTITSVDTPTQTTLNITWSPPTGGANSYNLVWCSGSGCTPSTVIAGVTSVYTHNGPLTCGTLYSYKLRALNAGGGTSADSATVANTSTSTCATAPTISVNPSASYGSYTRTGVENTPWTMSFTATDSEQTGAGALTYYVHTGAGRTGTQVATGTFTSGAAQNINIAYNATGLVSGSNTLYLSVYDGALYSATNPSFTVLRDDASPTASTTISHTPNPVTSNQQYTVTFTPADVLSTSTNEIAYQIRTAASGGGTLLTSGTSTNATPKTTATITESTLVSGGNTRYIRTCDGANNCSDTSFTVTYSPEPSTVGTSNPTGISSFYVTLNGSANPNGVATTGHFRIFTTSQANCSSDSGGSRYPTLSANDIVLTANTSVQNYSYTIPLNSTSLFLTPNTTYWYCSYAINANGTTGASSVVSFTTPFGPANPCDAPLTGNLTLPANSSCSMEDRQAFDGVDAGSGTTNTASLTLASGVEFIIPAGQTIGRGSVIVSGGTLTLAQGASVRRGGVWVQDSDGDGILDGNSKLVQSTQPAGYIRRTAFKEAATTNATSSAGIPIYAKQTNATTVFDCNSTNGNVYRTIPSLVSDADNDGYKTAAAAATQCVGTSSIINERTYYKNASNASTWLDSAAALSGGATDCDDTTGAPCAPTVGTVTAASQTSTTVTWSATTGPAQTSYTVTCVSGGTCSNSNRGTQSSGFTDSGLTCGTSYTYKVYAVNAAGTSPASSNFSGSTSACSTAPTVTTPTHSSVTDTTATLGANVTSDGGAAITARGTCWGTSPAPTTNCVAQGGTTTGVFTHARTGITANTLIYYRGYATNSVGTSYSADSSFTTLKSNGTTCTLDSQCASGNCYVDADGDRYYPGSGTKTCKASTSLGTDCDDGNQYADTNRSVATDADQDGYGTSAASSQCMGASTTVSSRTYYKNTAATYSYVASASMIGQPDCNDASAGGYLNRTCYADADNDTYTVSGSTVTCGTTSSCNGTTEKSAASGTVDCNETTSNVKPNQTSYFTASIATGPGSGAGAVGTWDYDCSNLSDKQYAAHSFSTGLSDVCQGTSRPSGTVGYNTASSIACGNSAYFRYCYRFNTSDCAGDWPTANAISSAYGASCPAVNGDDGFALQAAGSLITQACH